MRAVVEVIIGLARLAGGVAAVVDLAFEGAFIFGAGKIKGGRCLAGKFVGSLKVVGQGIGVVDGPFPLDFRSLRAELVGSADLEEVVAVGEVGKGDIVRARVEALVVEIAFKRAIIFGAIIGKLGFTTAG